ncbi:hypothetical protein HRbin13_00179 [bacterium HR13]|nr:hypothetical protein HRbin13_00179 [bacterium HR13]
MKNQQVSDKILPNLSLSVVETHVVRRGKAYRCLQLKGYLTKDGKLKSKTLKSWKPEDALELRTLVKLYRAVKHLSKALDCLY